MGGVKAAALLAVGLGVSGAWAQEAPSMGPPGPVLNHPTPAEEAPQAAPVAQAAPLPPPSPRPGSAPVRRR